MIHLGLVQAKHVPHVCNTNILLIVITIKISNKINLVVLYKKDVLLHMNTVVTSNVSYLAECNKDLLLGCPHGVIGAELETSL